MLSGILEGESGLTTTPAVARDLAKTLGLGALVLILAEGGLTTQ